MMTVTPKKCFSGGYERTNYKLLREVSLRLWVKECSVVISEALEELDQLQARTYILPISLRLSFSSTRKCDLIGHRSPATNREPCISSPAQTQSYGYTQNTTLGFILRNGQIRGIIHAVESTCKLGPRVEMLSVIVEAALATGTLQLSGPHRLSCHTHYSNESRFITPPLPLQRIQQL